MKSLALLLFFLGLCLFTLFGLSKQVSVQDRIYLRLSEHLREDADQYEVNQEFLDVFIGPSEMSSASSSNIEAIRKVIPEARFHISSKVQTTSGEDTVSEQKLAENPTQSSAGGRSGASARLEFRQISDGIELDGLISTDDREAMDHLVSSLRDSGFRVVDQVRSTEGVDEAEWMEGLPVAVAGFLEHITAGALHIDSDQVTVDLEALSVGEMELAVAGLAEDLVGLDVERGDLKIHGPVPRASLVIADAEVDSDFTSDEANATDPTPTKEATLPSSEIVSVSPIAPSGADKPLASVVGRMSEQLAGPVGDGGEVVVVEEDQEQSPAPSLSVQVFADRVIVDGAVDFPATRESIVKIVERLLEKRKLTDSLTTGSMTQPWMGGVGRLVGAFMSTSQEGNLILSDATGLTLDGQVDSDKSLAALDTLSRGIAGLSGLDYSQSLEVSVPVPESTGGGAGRAAAESALDATLSMKWERANLIVGGTVSSEAQLAELLSWVNDRKMKKGTVIDRMVAGSGINGEIIDRIGPLLSRFLDTAEKGEVDIDEGVVRLWGIVPDLESRKTLGALFAGAARDFTVINNLALKPRLAASRSSAATGSGGFAPAPVAKKAEPIETDLSAEQNGVATVVVYFGSNSEAISSQEKTKIREAAKVARASPDEGDFLLLVSGFADPYGNIDYNRQLSDRRAKAVASALEGFGVPANRIRLESYGEGNASVGSGKSSERRRVEIEILRSASDSG